MNIEYSAVTGAPRILIQANPCWDQWAELCEAVWITALEGGSNYWLDRVDCDSKFSIKSGSDLIKNFDVTVLHNADEWHSVSNLGYSNALLDPNPDFDGEITKGKSLDIVARGINGLAPDVKMSVMFPETCDIDAAIADSIIQCGLFGSEVYG